MIKLIQVAYVFGIVINVAGFAGAVGQTVPIGATYIYRLNYFSGFIVASVSYYIMSRIWPAKAVPERWTEEGDQDVAEAQLSHDPSDEYEHCTWKIDEAARERNSFSDPKLRVFESPSGSNN